jgi:hypothetical protein
MPTKPKHRETIRLHVCVPVQLHSQSKLAAFNRRMTLTAWVFEAMEHQLELDRRIFEALAEQGQGDAEPAE